MDHNTTTMTTLSTWQNDENASRLTNITLKFGICLAVCLTICLAQFSYSEQ